MKKMILVPALLLMGLMPSFASAHEHGGFRLGIGIGFPLFGVSVGEPCYPREVYVAPPVVCEPAPVVVESPAPVYVAAPAPAPQYAPAPEYAPAPPAPQYYAAPQAYYPAPQYYYQPRGYYYQGYYYAR